MVGKCYTLAELTENRIQFECELMKVIEVNSHQTIFKI